MTLYESESRKFFSIHFFLFVFHSIYIIKKDVRNTIDRWYMEIGAIETSHVAQNKIGTNKIKHFTPAS